MDIDGKKLVVIGGAGLIGSHTVDRLLQEDVRRDRRLRQFRAAERPSNLEEALKDPRVRIFEIGGDICQSDILDGGIEGR